MDAWLELQALPGFWTTTAKIMVACSALIMASILVALWRAGVDGEVLSIIAIAVLAFHFLAPLAFQFSHDKKTVDKVKEIVVAYVEEEEGISSSDNIQLLDHSGEKLGSRNPRLIQNASFRGINKDGELVDVEVSWLGVDANVDVESEAGKVEPITIKVTPIGETSNKK